MTSRKYTLWSVGLTLSMVSAIGAFNWIVDPYYYFGNNRLGVYISAEREAKPRMLLHYPHDALLVGNSKAAMIPAGQLAGHRFFNGAFGGASVEEMYHFVNHFATTQALVLLSVDLGHFSQGKPAGDLFAPRSMQDRLDKLTSLKSVEYSCRTIRSHLSGESPHMSADGSFIARRWFELYDRENPDELRYTLQTLKGGFDRYDREPGTGMEYYRKMAAVLKERRIACVVFIPPLHEELARHLQASTNYAKILLWKRELEAIFPRVLDYSIGPYSRAQNFFKADPVHFKPEVGGALINAEVMPKIPPPGGGEPGGVPRPLN